MVELKRLQEIHDEIAPELSYEPLDYKDWKLLDPDQVRESNKGNCLDVSLLALDTIGEGDLLYAEKPSGEGHSVPIFEHDSGLYWVELLDKSGVYGPFKDMSEVTEAFMETYTYPDDTDFCSITYDELKDSVGASWKNFNKTVLTPECMEKYSEIPVFKLSEERNLKDEQELLESGQIPEMIYYAIYVIKGRWPEVEPYISKDPKNAVWYAHEVIKGRWPEAEKYIADDYEAIYDYIRLVTKGRWPEAEPTIIRDSEIAGWYAEEILDKRWPEAEKYIAEDPNAWRNYLEFLEKKGQDMDAWEAEGW